MYRHFTNKWLVVFLLLTGTFVSRAQDLPLSIGHTYCQQAVDVAVAANGDVYVLTAGGVQVFRNNTYLRGFNLYPHDFAFADRPEFTSMAIGPDGNVYVVNQGEYHVVVCDPAGTFLGTFGSFSSTAQPGYFNNPYGIAIDNEGNIYVSDYGFGNIQVFNSSWSHIQTRTNALYAAIRGIAIDEYKNIYAVDVQNRRFIINRYGSNAEFPIPSDGLVTNFGIAVDDQGNIYVTEQGSDSQGNSASKVRVFANDGTPLRIIGSPGTNDNQLLTAYGVEVVGDKVYVASMVSDKVVIYDREGAYIATLGGESDQPGKLSNADVFATPYGSWLAMDSKGNLYAVDDRKEIIQVFNPSGDFIRTIGTRGTGEGQLNRLYCIAIDAVDQLYAVDNYGDRIQVFNPNGTFLRQITPREPVRSLTVTASGKILAVNNSQSKVLQYSNDGTFELEIPTSGRIRNITTDAGENIYVLQESDFGIHIFTKDGTPVRKIGSYGNSPGQFYSSAYVAVDRDKNIYVVDYKNQVSVFTNEGDYLTRYDAYGEHITPGLIKPLGIAVQGGFQGGRIAILDALRLVVFETPGTDDVMTFDPIPEKTFDDAPFELVTTSKYSVTYSSSNSKVAAITGNKVTIKGAGTAYITAREDNTTPGWGTKKITRELVVKKAPQLLSLELPGTLTLADDNLELNATSNSPLPIYYSSSNPAVASIAAGRLDIHQTGTFNLRLWQSGNENYLDGVLVIPITVTKVPQGLVFEPLPEMVYSDQPFELAATSTSGKAITFSSSDPAIASIEGNLVTLHKAGTVRVTATQPEDDWYAGSEIMHVLVIRKAPQSITFDLPAIAQFEAGALDFTATATSGLPVEIFSSDVSIASVAGNRIIFHQEGEVTFTATQPGNDGWDAAEPVVRTLIITVKQVQTIDFAPLASRIFGEAPFTLQATSSAGLPVSFTSSDPSVATIEGNTVTLRGGGSTVITASQDGNENYLPASVEQVLVVELVTGIENPERLASIYPNPTADVMIISMRSMDHKIRILDTVGRAFVVTAEKTAEGFKADIRHLATGVYTVIINAGNKILTARIVKE